MRVTVAQLAAIVGGEVVGGGHERPPNERVVTSFTIDSRVLARGACFVALEGTRDGHAFVADAFAAGAAVALVRRAVTAPGPQVVVADPPTALGRLAAVAREQLDASVVGITGSVGKTATKDLVAAATASTRRVHASPASYNNEFGVPLTLLSAPTDVDLVVCEMGARSSGDLTLLSEIARPEIGAITAVALAHSTSLGDLAEIARTKGELVEHLPAGGTAVLNADMPYADTLAERTSARVLTVGSAHADVVHRGVRLDEHLQPTFELATPWGTHELSIRLRGAHQAANAAMAAAIALAADVSLDAVVEGLATAQNAPRRMELHRTPREITVLDDTYNANPASTAAALRALRALPARRRIAVLGEMLELGEDRDAAHRDLGRLASDLEIDLVIIVAEGAAAIADGVSEPTRVITVEDRDAAANTVISEALGGDAVLVKASRAIGLETVVDQLLEADPSEAGLRGGRA